MKVNELVKVLTTHYQQDEELFVMWWDGQFLYDRHTDDHEFTMEELTALWERIVKQMEEDDSMDSAITNTVVDYIQFHAYEEQQADKEKDK